MVEASSSAAVASFGGGGGNQSLCWPAPRQSCFVFIARAIVFVCAPVAPRCCYRCPPQTRAKEN